MTVGVVFPGQGAHRPGMASAWAGHPASEVFAQVGQVIGLPDLAGLADDPAACGATAVGQPAVYAAGLAAWQALVAEGVEAHVVAGHSLGEITAAVASGVLSVEDGARLVGERARAFADACARTPGTMTAVLGMDRTAVEEQIGGVDGVRIANDNAPGQVVLSGPPAQVDEAAAACREQGGRVRPLDVEGAFHTPAMRPAMDRVRNCLKGLAVSDPRVPLVSGATATPARSAAAVQQGLVEGILAPVRWRAVQQQLVSSGAQAVVEAGPGGVLRGLARRTIPDVEVWAADSPQAAAEVAGHLSRTETASRQ